VRTFVPYLLKGRAHLLARTCARRWSRSRWTTSRTRPTCAAAPVGEFGSGNYPLDMVVYKKDGKEKLLIANSNLPFLIVDPKGRRGLRRA
jgi:hypothetical protein